MCNFFVLKPRVNLGSKCTVNCRVMRSVDETTELPISRLLLYIQELVVEESIEEETIEETIHAIHSHNFVILSCCVIFFSLLFLCTQQFSFNFQDLLASITNRVRRVNGAATGQSNAVECM